MSLVALGLLVGAAVLAAFAYAHHAPHLTRCACAARCHRLGAGLAAAAVVPLLLIVVGLPVKAGLAPVVSAGLVFAVVTVLVATSWQHAEAWRGWEMDSLTRRTILPAAFTTGVIVVGSYLLNPGAWAVL